MKRFLFPVLFAFAFFLSACGPTGLFAPVIALPEPLKLSITGLFVWLVAFLFAKLITLVPFLKFLEPYKTPIAMAAAAAVIGWIELNTPDAYGAAVVAAIQLILVILALFGVGEALKQRGVKFFQ